jgi:hypothetical protein
MSGLAALQADFQGYLLRGEAAVAARIAASERVPVPVRLAIYGDAYRGRLVDALASNYPALAALLDEDFRELGERYVATHDSPYYNIRWYGEELAQFLGTEERYASTPLLAELARWEWAMRAAFDAADAPVLSHAALGQVDPGDWAQLRFAWHPSLERLDLNWNAPPLWQALTQDGERPPLSFSSEPTPWLIWRQDFTTYFRSLEPLEATALDAARAGWPFGELCEHLCARLGEDAAPLQAARYLQGWIGAGLIRGLR